MLRNFVLTHYLDPAPLKGYANDCKVEVSFNATSLVEVLDGYKLFLKACEYSADRVDNISIDE